MNKERSQNTEVRMQKLGISRQRVAFMTLAFNFSSFFFSSFFQVRS